MVGMGDVSMSDQFPPIWDARPEMLTAWFDSIRVCHGWAHGYTCKIRGGHDILGDCTLSMSLKSKLFSNNYIRLPSKWENQKDKIGWLLSP